MNCSFNSSMPLSNGLGQENLAFWTFSQMPKDLHLIIYQLLFSKDDTDEDFATLVDENVQRPFWQNLNPRDDRFGQVVSDNVLTRKYRVQCDQLVLLPEASSFLEYYLANPFGGDAVFSRILESYRGTIRVISKEDNQPNTVVYFVMKQLQSRQFSREDFDTLVDCSIKLLEINPYVTRDVSEGMSQAYKNFTYNLRGYCLGIEAAKAEYEEEKSYRVSKLQICVSRMKIIPNERIEPISEADDPQPDLQRESINTSLVTRRVFQSSRRRLIQMKIKNAFRKISSKLRNSLFSCFPHNRHVTLLS